MSINPVHVKKQTPVQLVHVVDMLQYRGGGYLFGRKDGRLRVSQNNQMTVQVAIKPDRYSWPILTLQWVSVNASTIRSSACQLIRAVHENVAIIEKDKRRFFTVVSVYRMNMCIIQCTKNLSTYRNVS